MVYADLHIHSLYSDGIYSPKEILEIAEKSNIKCISITDHDSLITDESIYNNSNNIKVIPGIELSSMYGEKEIHILGYNIDIYNKKLKDTLKKINISRIERVKKIIDKLKESNIYLNYGDLVVGRDTVGRGNIAQLMVNKGYVLNNYEAFSNYLAKGKCAYVKGEKLNSKEAIELINGSGGISVLAHPGKVYKNIRIEKIIREFKMYGIKGLEIYHPSHSIEKTNYFYNMSKKYKLLVTGGSDFHGNDNKKCKIGSKGISEEMLLRIINAE